MHIIISSSLVSKKRKGNKVEVDDIKKVYDLFVDLKRSTAYMMDSNNNEFMFNEIEEEQDEIQKEEETKLKTNLNNSNIKKMETD